MPCPTFGMTSAHKAFGGDIVPSPPALDFAIIVSEFFPIV